MSKNIIWSRPDGGVSVTPITPTAQAQMQWASEILAAGKKASPEAIKQAQKVRDTIGLDEHEHERILLRKDERAAADATARGVPFFPAHLGNECVGHNKPTPADLTYRDGWVWDGSEIVHDMARCKEIHRQRIRAMRPARFAKLDADWMKATASGDSAGAASAEAKRQQLRDAPAHQAIEAASTPEELKAAIPEGLKP